MTISHRFILWLCVLVPAAAGTSPLFAQSSGPSLYQEMRWRMIGPHRGGRTVGAAGVPEMPNVFYVGVNNGGVWKTVDYGRTWKPVFDDQPTGSIGSLAVAPSDPAVKASVLLQKDLGDLLARWEGLRKNQIARMNEKLRTSHFPGLVAE